MSQKINIFWFRRDLRLTDNVGLYQSLNSNIPVLPLFIFDENILSKLKNKNDSRMNFIYQTIVDLAIKLRQHQARMVVKYGDPQKIFDQLLKEYHVETVYANHDYEPYARDRDERISDLLHKSGVQFKTFKDQVIFEKDEILTKNGHPYNVYTPYSIRWRENLTTEVIAPNPSEKLGQNFLRQDFVDLPLLKSMGFNSSAQTYPKIKIDPQIIERYHETRDYPGMNGTSRLGMHLRFGTVSIRELVRAALELNEIWLGELIWREFFMMILWHFPHVVNKPFKRKYEAIPWRNDPQSFDRWCRGETGYPIVDAGMRELNQTGYMHNRVRMITASFLTKHLLIDWRQGERYFAEKLNDYELASNNGNWQWAAGCGVDAAPYFRIFNPYIQAERFDPDHIYIKKWVPEYDNIDYPDPIIEHKLARQRALDVYSAALGK